MYPQYMCILLYVKLIWCNGIPYIYCQLELWGVSCMSSVYVHCAVCDTDLVEWYSIYFLSIGVLKGWVHVSSVYMNSAICKTYLV